MRPDNPFRVGSSAWELMEKDWSDCTVEEIAERLFVDDDTVRTNIRRIRKRTGYSVPYKRRKRGKDDG